eukprot:gb/GECH01011564.1/.p1 GENE.gb/GECH01011564.1/~~gb/GECH01011564.1/.p1  ORF type:complete len:646 (+),score=202.14 gb/GECH01011564.1/:1-1938(+)
MNHNYHQQKESFNSPPHHPIPPHSYSNYSPTSSQPYSDPHSFHTNYKPHIPPSHPPSHHHPSSSSSSHLMSNNFNHSSISQQQQHSHEFSYPNTHSHHQHYYSEPMPSHSFKTNYQSSLSHNSSPTVSFESPETRPSDQFKLERLKNQCEQLKLSLDSERSRSKSLRTKYESKLKSSNKLKHKLKDRKEKLKELRSKNQKLENQIRQNKTRNDSNFNFNSNNTPSNNSNNDTQNDDINSTEKKLTEFHVSEREITIETVYRLLQGKFSLDQIATAYDLSSNRQYHVLASNLNAVPDFETFLENAHALSSSKFECPVCIEDLFETQGVTLPCPQEHLICEECWPDLIENAIKSSKPIQCPSCQNDRSGDAVIRFDQMTNMTIQNNRTLDLLEQYREMDFKRDIKAAGCITCPRCDHPVDVDSNQRIRVECPSCQHRYCSKCRRDYHVWGSCKDLPAIEGQWAQWNTTGRQKRWDQLEENEKQYRQAQKQHESNREAVEQRNRDLKQRFDELKADEEWKANNCKLCPNCGRVINRMQGCNSMVCGQDSGGGNNQNGCGRQFNWGSAANYRPDYGAGPRQEVFNAAEPKPVEHVSHDVPCDECGKNIEGLRFRCVFCHHFQLCERCEEQASLKHDQGHFFEILTKPDA